MNIPDAVIAVGDALPDGFERRERQLLALGSASERRDSAGTDTDRRH